jgi:hypothetical protein
MTSQFTGIDILKRDYVMEMLNNMRKERETIVEGATSIQNFLSDFDFSFQAQSADLETNNIGDFL